MVSHEIRQNNCFWSCKECEKYAVGYVKAFGMISSGTATLGDGTATFKVYKKPVTDIVVGLKGV